MDSPVSISLYELNCIVKKVVSQNFSQRYWVIAETSDVKVNQKGHCYLELIEKDKTAKNIIARVKAMIWSNSFYLLQSFFEQSAKQPFRSGIKVLVEVSVEFHELYGFSFIIHDINPTYTVGEQIQLRAEIIKQLEDEGVASMNKDILLNPFSDRIAVISSPTAAGYEDFYNQLKNNPYGFIFYTKLFPAIMQGTQAANSIVEALEIIYEYIDYFDAVVIIRGGGSTSDLSCFDSYLLAASCAQFPLPIITGIGHERDETAVDLVAYKRAKTPTAVAEFLITHLLGTVTFLNKSQVFLGNHLRQYVDRENHVLSAYESRISYYLNSWIKDQFINLNTISLRLKRETRRCFDSENDKLNIYSKMINLVSPDNVLKKGYSLTMKDGKIVRKHDIMKGDILTTKFIDGNITSTVE